MTYTPDAASLWRHPLPAWYDEAKFGIFVHWSLSSVPAFASTGKGDFSELARKGGVQAGFLLNPYSEWYLNGLRMREGPVWEHHRATWGEGFPYERFKDLFNERLTEWDPEAWAEAFRAVGARYVVLVAKHHDGFCLWPSEVKNPNTDGYHASRDVVGELTEAVRARGMKMGLYYSGSLDWTFSKRPILSAADLVTSGDSSPEYGAYAEAQYRELVERYRPSVLWNDIGYPPMGRLFPLLADYYNQVPDGLVNDRWMQASDELRAAMEKPLYRALAAWLVRRAMVTSRPLDPGVPFDHATLEYTVSKAIRPWKWECVRGVGHSFGYVAEEPEENFLSPSDAAKLLVSVVSAGGNLLLNVGPMPGGQIPEPQLRCLRGLGAWLAANGESIYCTRPWRRAGTRTKAGGVVRFTAKGVDLYATLGEPPRPGGGLVLSGLRLPVGSRVSILATGVEVPAVSRGAGTRFDFPAADLGDMPVVLKIAGANRARPREIRKRRMPRAVRAVVGEKTAGAFLSALLIATVLVIAVQNPATARSALWSLAFASVTVLCLGVAMSLDVTAQARKELFRGSVAVDVAPGDAAAAGHPAALAGLWREIGPHAILHAAAASALLGLLVLAADLLGFVMPPLLLVALIVPAVVAGVGLPARKLLPRVTSRSAPFVHTPATSEAVGRTRYLLLDHLLPRLALMTAMNLMVGLMVAAGHIARGPTVTALESRRQLGLTFLVLLLYCFRSSRDHVVGDVWSGRRALSARRERIGPLLGLAVLVGLSFVVGFAYHGTLAIFGVSVLSPFAALAHRMIAVWLATVLGCVLGVSWTVPRESRRVRDRFTGRG